MIDFNDEVFPSEEEYNTFRFDLLKNVEGNSLTPYYDSVNKVTIGIGFNIGDRGVARSAVLGELGFAPGSYSSASANLAEQEYLNEINGLLSGPRIADLNAQLDDIMARRASDTRYSEAERADMHTSFAFRNDTEVKAVFDEIIEDYEDNVDGWLAGIPNSKERAVLVSLSWNDVLTESLSLKNAISNDNRAEAWFQIRYHSNGGESRGPGIAKRRYYESQVFGLYDPDTTADNISETEAKAVYQMYTDHLVKILDESYQWSAEVANANGDYDTGTDHVQTLEESFDFAYQFLLQKYVQPTGSDITINALDIQIATNTASVLQGNQRDNYRLNYGQEQNDLLIGADDSQWMEGGGGNDILYGEGGEDYLDGGDGNDYLIGGTGQDELYGGIGNDTFIIEGTDTAYDNFQGGDGTDTIRGADTAGNLDDTIRVTSLTDVNSIEEIDGGGGTNYIKGTGEADVIDLTGITVTNIDAIDGEAGGDTLTGSKADDTLVGGADQDILVGGKGDDTLYGGEQSNAQSDNDIDILRGGDDHDTYYAGGNDIITDSDGHGEVIFLGSRLTGGTHQESDPAGQYEGNGGIYRWPGGKLTFTKEGKTLVINDFDNRELGIYLDEAEGSDDSNDPPPDDSTTQESPDRNPSPPTYTSSNATITRRDPLILDLNGNGQIDAIASTQSTVYFDYNSDNIYERSGWIAPGDGLLVLDSNGNGVIDNLSELSELFGSDQQDGLGMGSDQANQLKSKQLNSENPRFQPQYRPF